MADGFIVRKGGAVGTAAPSINFVSSTFDSITFTITNNDALTADIFWEIGDSTPDANTLSLAGGATSSNQVASGLDEETSYTIFAFANAAGKAGSQTSSIAQTTPAEPIVYTAATGGTTEEYDLDDKRYKSHTFTSDGNFVVTQVGNGDRNQVDYLIIAGGGGGGGSGLFSSDGPSGGGGAGGYRTTFGTQGGNGELDTKPTVTAQTYGVVVGAGGVKTVNGDNSSVFSRIAEGGGRGASNGGAGLGTPEVGGSGGGAGGSGGSSQNGASGTEDQGFAGGNNLIVSGTARATGGGGGAGAVGANGNSSASAGNGGNGLASIIRTGSSETRAGGGGGGGWNVAVSAGTGGTGGGGNGTSATSSGGTAGSGAVNTGSGGGGVGGGSIGSGGDGGSGIVVIRYEIAPSV
jgi:hypothetical protein